MSCRIAPIFFSDLITPATSAAYLAQIVLFFNFTSSAASCGKFSSRTFSAVHFQERVFSIAVKCRVLQALKISHKTE